MKREFPSAGAWSGHSTWTRGEGVWFKLPLGGGESALLHGRQETKQEGLCGRAFAFEILECSRVLAGGEGSFLQRSLST